MTKTSKKHVPKNYLNRWHVTNTLNFSLPCHFSKKSPLPHTVFFFCKNFHPSHGSPELFPACAAPQQWQTFSDISHPSAAGHMRGAGHSTTSMDSHCFRKRILPLLNHIGHKTVTCSPLPCWPAFGMKNFSSQNTTPNISALRMNSQ